MAMAILFLLPALVNGFPLVFSDTDEYVYSAAHVSIPGDRPVYYSIFTNLLDLRLSPWPSIVIQALLTSWIICRFASTFFGIASASKWLLLGFILTLCSSLPWFVGEIMPDIFTAIMIMALALLCLVADTLPRSLAITLVILIGVSVGFHQANLVVALWLLPALGLCTMFGLRWSRSLRYGLLASAIGLTLGAAALLTQNLFHHRFALSSGGSVFLMARLLEDGTALNYLENTCPQRRFAVCPPLDKLRSKRATIMLSTAPEATFHDYFLWDGPLNKLGGFQGEEKEANAIIAGTLSTYPLKQLRATVYNGWRQMIQFRTGAELDPYPETWFVSRAIRDVFGPTVYDRYRKSLQISGDLVHQINWIRHIHSVVIVISFLIIISWFIIGGSRKQPRAFFTCIFVMDLLVGNAFTLGGLSGPFDRYQARVIWLVPLLASCLVLSSRAQNQARNHI